MRLVDAIQSSHGLRDIVDVYMVILAVFAL